MAEWPEVVETVARAIHDMDEDHDYFIEWESDSEWVREDDRKMAVAVLAAIKKAGYELCLAIGSDPSSPDAAASS